MTLKDGFDRTVSDWLHDEAGRGAPIYLDEVLSRTTRTRQRPAWSSLERWLPVDLAAQPPRIGWRQAVRPIAILAILALLVAATLAVYIGTRQSIPPPFGPARNGAVVYAQAGDLYVAPASLTGPGTPLVTGPGNDYDPTFSPSGRFLSFLRSTSQSPGAAAVVLAVANADGGGVREITDTLLYVSQVVWSPDESQIAVVSDVKGSPTISIVRSDGGGTSAIDTGMAIDLVAWRAPDGREIVFRGHTGEFDDETSGLFTILPDGSGLRPLTAAGRDVDYRFPVVSPDGSKLTYDRWNGSQNDIHVLDLSSGTDVALPRFDPLTDQGGVALFSPDGALLVFERYYDGGDLQLAVAPADGSSAGRGIGPRQPTSATPDRWLYEFAPDGLTVIARYADDRTAYILPVDGSEGTVVPWGEISLPTVQRLAP